jgi:hypothetical protein
MKTAYSVSLTNSVRKTEDRRESGGAVMSEKKVVGYRACRAQRYTGPQGLHWRFSLPIDTRRFDTAKEAFEHCKKLNGIQFKDNWFDIQEMYSDGTFSEQPKRLEDWALDLSEESEPVAEKPTVAVTAEPSEWEKKWGFKVDSSLIKKREHEDS